MKTLALMSLFISVLANCTGAGIDDKNCSDFTSRAEANVFFYENDPLLDPHDLDPDRNFIPCEDLP